MTRQITSKKEVTGGGESSQVPQCGNAHHGRNAVPQCGNAHHGRNAGPQCGNARRGRKRGSPMWQRAPREADASAEASVSASLRGGLVHPS